MTETKQPGTIVITHRIPAHVTPLGEWLSEVADRVVLVTSDEAAAGYRTAFPDVRAVSDYSAGTGVAAELDRLCRTRDVARLVHMTEDDVVRVAEARDRFDVPGLRTKEALIFRDKLLMKDQVSAAVRTPAYRAPVSGDDAVAFGESVGWPVVVKPRLGYGSRGVCVVRSADELRAELSRRDVTDRMVEQFVPGPVYHVDGFMRDGRLLFGHPSRYLNDCLAFQDSTPLGSVQLDAGSTVSRALEDFAASVVATMPPTELSPFHLEVFEHEADGEFYFCEIACRLGGGHVLESLTYTTGVNPARLWARHQAGLVDDQLTFGRSGTRFGWLLVPPRRGTLLEIERRPLPGFVRGFHRIETPARFDGASASTDAVVSFLVEGPSAAEVERNLRQCARIATEMTRWRRS